MICPHCGDRFQPVKCDTCHRTLTCCYDCHNELQHGQVPPAERITASRAGVPGPHDDLSPGTEDAIRALEDCR